MNSHRSSSYRVPDHVAFTQVGGDTVLLDLRDGTYFGLNAVASRIWLLIDEGQPNDQIVETLLIHFNVSRSQLTMDLKALTRELIERQLLELL